MVAGSQRHGLSPLSKEGHHNTLLVGSRAACTALNGHTVLVDHWPTVAGSSASTLEAKIKGPKKKAPGAEAKVGGD